MICQCTQPERLRRSAKYQSELFNILKTLSNKFGFHIANIIQALLFGLLHGVMLFSLVGVVKAILIILFTGVIAWFMGYINEKISNGSIIPSWTIHTVSNLFSGICAAFSMTYIA